MADSKKTLIADALAKLAEKGVAIRPKTVLRKKVVTAKETKKLLATGTDATASILNGLREVKRHNSVGKDIGDQGLDKYASWLGEQGPKPIDPKDLPAPNCDSIDLGQSIEMNPEQRRQVGELAIEIDALMSDPTFDPAEPEGNEAYVEALHQYPRDVRRLYLMTQLKKDLGRK